MTGTRVLLTEGNAAPKKISKIIPYPDGGFGIAAPYHHARTGWLIKFPVDYSQYVSHAPISSTTAYSASDRVKLSFHPDGFVQFSGERPGRITSGRDENGRPKGLGILINPLGTRLATVGPNFAIAVWGLHDFEEAKTVDDSLIFEEDDYYYRDCAVDTWIGYLIEGFVFPRYRPIRAADITRRGLVLPLRFPVTVRSQTDSGIVLPSRTPLFEGRTTSIFNLRLIDLPEQDLVIGLMATRTRLGFDSPSGFVLSGPSDMKHGLMALYPNPGNVPDLPTIDYTADPNL